MSKLFSQIFLRIGQKLQKFCLWPILARVLVFFTQTVYVFIQKMMQNRLKTKKILLIKISNDEKNEVQKNVFMMNF